MRNRRLFPAATEANETIECSNFCDPACPYNCYPYQDYYYLPPLPPPPPPPPPFLVENHYISPYVIILVSVLASFILLIGYYVIIVKSCFGWCCWRNNSRLPQPRADGSNEEFVDENRVDHPIWFITTVGLQQSIINSITVCKYKKGEGLIEGTECSVCLNEFREDETVRLLPKCNHAFHISCIDTWLRGHTNCPLCRAPIVFDAAICSSNTPASADRNPDNIVVIDDDQIDNSENGGIISDENRAERELVETNDQRGGVAKEITQLKRCVSMDSSSSSSSAASLFIGIQDDVENPDSTKENWSGNSSFAQGIHLSPVEMKRSFSCGGRFFSSSKRYLSMNSNLPP